MGMSHAACDHEASSKARARCRKARSALQEGGTDQAGDGATIITVDFTDSPGRGKQVEGFGYYNARTPRDKDQECMSCRVNQLMYKGHDEHGRLLYVCGPCSWRLLAEDKVMV